MSKIFDGLDSIEFKKWGINKNTVLPYIGTDKLFRSVEDIEEFYHQFDSLMEYKNGVGQKVRNPAGFFCRCLQQGYINPPPGYLSLDEKREKEKQEELDNRAREAFEAKRETYIVEFEVFKEGVDEETREGLLTEIKSNSDVSPNLVGRAAYDRTVSAKLEEALRTKFLERYESPELRREAERYLLGGNVG